MLVGSELCACQHLWCTYGAGMHSCMWEPAGAMPASLRTWSTSAHIHAHLHPIPPLPQPHAASCGTGPSRGNAEGAVSHAPLHLRCGVQGILWRPPGDGASGGGAAGCGSPLPPDSREGVGTAAARGWILECQGSWQVRGGLQHRPCCLPLSGCLRMLACHSARNTSGRPACLPAGPSGQHGRPRLSCAGLA